jgi:hypothetical protein
MPYKSAVKKPKNFFNEKKKCFEKDLKKLEINFC